MSATPSPESSPKIKSFYDLKAELKSKTLDFSDLRGKVRPFLCLPPQLARV